MKAMEGRYQTLYWLAPFQGLAVVLKINTGYCQIKFFYTFAADFRLLWSEMNLYQYVSIVSNN